MKQTSQGCLGELSCNNFFITVYSSMDRNWVAVATAAVTPNVSSHWKHLKIKHLCYHYTTDTETAAIGWSDVLFNHNYLLWRWTFCLKHHFYFNFNSFGILQHQNWIFGVPSCIRVHSHWKLWLFRFLWWNYRHSEHEITPLSENPTAKIYIIAMW